MDYNMIGFASKIKKIYRIEVELNWLPPVCLNAKRSR
jgi:hypothetical protein